MKRDFDEKFLLRILETPTAPFCESQILRVLTETLTDHSVPWFLDPIGNLVIGSSTETEYKLRLEAHADEPHFLVIAHIDHPGFHGVKWKSKSVLEVEWHGGSPVEKILKAPVWISNAGGDFFEPAVFSKAKIKTRSGGRKALGLSEVKLLKPLVGSQPEAAGLFGGFRFRAPVWKKGKLYYTKAADDLVGSFAAASLAIELWKGNHPEKTRFTAVLTRAEEVGFIGAIGHLELGWFRKKKEHLVAVSLETSRTLPGALIGKGPVVRLGDRSGVFDSKSLRTFSGIAEERLPGKHQKRIMDGGTCEATATQAYGIPSIGISIPLGNYHNQSFEGGPDSRGKNGPAPEFVHQDDIKGMQELLRGILESSPEKWTQVLETQKKALLTGFEHYRKLL